MADFLRVLGPKKFGWHIVSLNLLTPSFQHDIYEAFCDLCKRQDGSGLQIDDMTPQEARRLLFAFSKVLTEADFDTEVIGQLIDRSYPNGKIDNLSNPEIGFLLQ